MTTSGDGNNSIQAQLHQAILNISANIDFLRGGLDDLEESIAHIRGLYHRAGDTPGWQQALACLLTAYPQVQHQALELSGLNARLSRELPVSAELEGRGEIREEGWVLHNEHAGSRGNPIWIDIPAGAGPCKRKRPDGGDECDRFEQTRCPRLMHPWELNNGESQVACAETIPSSPPDRDLSMELNMGPDFADSYTLWPNGGWQDSTGQGIASIFDDDDTLGSSSEV